MAILVFSFTAISAQAADTANNTGAAGTSIAPSKVRASDNGDLFYNGPLNKQDDSGVWGVQVRAGAAGVPISAWNICRYIDNPTTKGDMLAPFGSLTEWSAFINNASGTGLYVDLCRPKHTLAYGTVAGKVDYTAGLSNVANLVAGNSVYVAVTDAPTIRIDTRSAALLTSFMNAKEDRTSSFPMTRTDCLGNITYPDGSVRNPCTKWTWTEAVTASFTYSLGTNNSVAKLRPLAVSAATASDVGSWNNPTFTRTCPVVSGTTTGGGATATPSPTCPPAVAAPQLQACPPGVAHNTEHWVDMGTNTEPATCPAGYVSDPTNPYTLSYTLQQNYLCFDSQDYPKTSTRHKPGSEQNFGKCLPVINGACGSANNTKLASAPSGSALCNAGDATVVTGTSPYTWSCVGKNTGTTATCKSANCDVATPFTGAACSALGLVGSGKINGTYNTDMCTPTYTGTWTASASGCSASCGGGTQSITYSCQGGNGQCNPFLKPANSTQSCNTQACYTGNWYATSSGCNATCGGGSETISFACSNGNCDPSAKPGSYTQQCNTQACPHVYTGYWYSNTGSCSVTACGSTGTQSITYACSNGDCDPATKPANGSQSCSTAACAPVYTGYWIANTGSCSVTACGSTGTQTTSYSCSNGNCDPSTKPADSSQSCSTAACATQPYCEWIPGTGKKYGTADEVEQDPYWLCHY